MKSTREETGLPLKPKLNWTKMYSANSVKQGGTKIDENLRWKYQRSDLAIKLVREDAILSKLRPFIDNKAICHAIFEPHSHYLDSKVKFD